MSYLLSRQLTQLKFGSSTQKHIWFRVPERQFPVTFLSRIIGKPFDILIRVPVSTLSKQPQISQNENIKSQNQVIFKYVSNWNESQSTRFLLLPRRRFGLGRKDPPFGHAKIPGRINWVEPFVYFMFLLAMLSVVIDWRKLKEEYGIDILPRFFYTAFTRGNDGDGTVGYFKSDFINFHR